MKPIPLFSALSALVALTGCESIGAPSDPLTAQPWHLESIERPSQPPVTLSGRAQDSHWIRFEEDGRLTASLDCNRGTGDWYRADGMVAPRGTIQIGEIASTRALCPTPSYGEEMAASLPLASDYMVEDGGRTLLLRTRTATYRFAAR